jgi:hypothetical protein
MDKRYSFGMFEEWRQQGLSGQTLCRTPMGAASSVGVVPPDKHHDRCVAPGDTVTTLGSRCHADRFAEGYLRHAAISLYSTKNGP